MKPSLPIILASNIIVLGIADEVFDEYEKKSNDEDKKAKFIVDSNYNIITPYVDNGIKQTILKDLLLSIENKESISEKIRLFYVALTRAREKIILVTPTLEDKEFKPIKLFME